MSRIHGFDILRGLCALSVAFYHLNYWSHTVDLKNVGLIGVNIFFILSGASIYVAYAQRLREGLPFANFLGQRIFRLAPLFWVLVIIAAIALHRSPSQALMNASFLFGLANPGQASILTGGWSLGIEFIFYLIFPVFLYLLSGGYKLPLIALVVLTYLQQTFVSGVIKVDGDIKTNWASYVQFISFIAYFLSGCLIGKAVPILRMKMAWLPFLLLGSLLFYICATSDDTIIAGLDGALIMGLCILVVTFSSQLHVPKKFVWAANAMGDLSYGVYLLHPFIYNRSRNFLGINILETLSPVAGIIICLAVTVAIALISERYYERPIRKRGYKLLHIK